MENIEKLDIEAIRRYVEDYYESAYFAGIPVAMADLIEVQSFSDEQIVEQAIKLGCNLEDYIQRIK